MSDLNGLTLAHLTKRQRAALTEDEIKALTERSDRMWQELEAARAVVHPITCATCQDQKVIAEETGDTYHPTRLVPCPNCGTQPPDPEASVIDDTPLLEFYDQHGGAQQTLIDMGDDE